MSSGGTSVKSLLNRIEELQESMQTFLTIVNEERSSADDISDSWALCEEHSTLLEDLKRDGPPDDPDLRMRMVAAIESLAQMNAILTDAVERQQQELTERLARMSKVVRTLENFRPPVGDGARCDIEG